MIAALALVGSVRRTRCSPHRVPACVWCRRRCRLATLPKAGTTSSRRNSTTSSPASVTTPMAAVRCSPVLALPRLRTRRMLPSPGTTSSRRPRPTLEPGFGDNTYGRREMLASAGSARYRGHDDAAKSWYYQQPQAKANFGPASVTTPTAAVRCLPVLALPRLRTRRMLPSPGTTSSRRPRPTSSSASVTTPTAAVRCLPVPARRACGHDGCCQGLVLPAAAGQGQLRARLR